MIKIFMVVIAFVIMATPAQAHPGHLNFDGFDHEHLSAFAALFGALMIGITLWLTRRGADQDHPEDDAL